MLVLGLPAQEAAGVSLTTMIFGLSSGSINYARQGRIDYKLGFVLGIVTVPGAILGAWVTQFMASDVLKLLLGLLLIPLAIRMLSTSNERPGPRKNVGNRKWTRQLIDRGGQEFRYVINHPLIGILAFFLIGFLSGLFGIGAGALRIPVFIFLLGVPMHVAIATSILTMVISSLAGAITHLDLGHVNLECVLWLVPAVICGAQIGAQLAKRTPPRILRKIFAFFLITAGVIILGSLWVLTPPFSKKRKTKNEAIYSRGSSKQENER